MDSDYNQLSMEKIHQYALSLKELKQLRTLLIVNLGNTLYQPKIQFEKETIKYKGECILRFKQNVMKTHFPISDLILGVENKDYLNKFLKMSADETVYLEQIQLAQNGDSQKDKLMGFFPEMIKNKEKNLLNCLCRQTYTCINT